MLTLHSGQIIFKDFWVVLRITEKAKKSCSTRHPCSGVHAYCSLHLKGAGFFG